MHHTVCWASLILTWYGRTCKCQLSFVVGCHMWLSNCHRDEFHSTFCAAKNFCADIEFMTWPTEVIQPSLVCMFTQWPEIYRVKVCSHFGLINIPIYHSTA